MSKIRIESLGKNINIGGEDLGLTTEIETEGGLALMPCGMALPIEAVVSAAERNEWRLTFVNLAGEEFPFGIPAAYRNQPSRRGAAADLSAEIREVDMMLSLMSMPGAPSPFLSDFGNVRAEAIEKVEAAARRLLGFAADLKKIPAVSAESLGLRLVTSDRPSSECVELMQKMTDEVAARSGAYIDPMTQKWVTRDGEGGAA